MGKILVVVGVVVLLLVIVFGIGAVGAYNRLVSLEEQVNSAWAQVDTVLQRRYDLIPNLVNTVKGYAAQEREVLTEVTRLRSQWGEARTPAERTQAATGLESALGRLMVVIENYPELKSNQNFLALQDELSGTENRIAVERRRFNETVQTYNSSLRRFPTNIIAGLLGFEARPYFEAPGAAREAPEVQF
ncbi:MAG TPA: LemA family protein [Acidobacteriota bacterium]|nr:LemA family protein [Acidobacteriota bacterium]